MAISSDVFKDYIEALDYDHYDYDYVPIPAVEQRIHFME